MSEDKNQTEVNDQLKDFKDNEKEYNKAIRDIVLFTSLGLALILHSAYSTVSMYFDDSIPLVVCPRDYDLDKPVIMKTIEQSNEAFIQDRWLRGFIREYTMSLFPRTDKDAKPFFDFIAKHSTPDVSTKYRRFLDDIERVEKSLQANDGIKFYPKASDGVRIRPTNTTGGAQTEWIVEVDGYLNKGYHQNAERTLPTIRMRLISQPATRSNPTGLAVAELNIDDKILDLVSGRRKVDSTEDKAE